MSENNKKVVMIDEAHLFAPKETKESREMRKFLYEFGKPSGYKSTIIEQSLKEKE